MVLVWLMFYWSVQFVWKSDFVCTVLCFYSHVAQFIVMGFVFNGVSLTDVLLKHSVCLKIWFRAHCSLLFTLMLHSSLFRSLCLMVLVWQMFYWSVQSVWKSDFVHTALNLIWLCVWVCMCTYISSFLFVGYMLLAFFFFNAIEVLQAFSPPPPPPTFLCHWSIADVFLTPSLPWCHLKMTVKSVKLETLQPFCFLFCSGMWKDFHQNA